MLHFPEYLAKHSEQSPRVITGEPETAHQAADDLFLLFAFRVATGNEGLVEQFRHAFQVGRFGGGNSFPNRCSPPHPDQVVKAYRDCLPQVHRGLLRLGGDSDQPVAVAEVLIREAALLRTEEQRDLAAISLATD